MSFLNGSVKYFFAHLLFSPPVHSIPSNNLTLTHVLPVGMKRIHNLISPLVQKIKISLTPRLFSSIKVERQYLALSLFPALMESTSFFPSVLVPRMI